MNLYELKEPKQWQAGTSGEKRTPFYFDCADCGDGSGAPEIAGFLGNSPEFEHIGVLGDKFPFRLALFCRGCFDKRTNAATERRST